MQINAVNATNIHSVATEAKQKSAEAGFTEMLQNFLAETNGQLQQAEKAEGLLKEGKVENMTSLVYEIEKSDIALKLVTEIRNKALESYQEIMRMQV